VLLAAMLDEREALSAIEVEDVVRRALGFISRTGPVTEQDRWEESSRCLHRRSRRWRRAVAAARRLAMPRLSSTMSGCLPQTCRSTKVTASRSARAEPARRTKTCDNAEALKLIMNRQFDRSVDSRNLSSAETGRILREVHQ